MNAFLIELENEPGELLKVAAAVAGQNINITGFGGSTCGDCGTVLLMTDNETATWDVLIGLGRIVREQEVVRVTVAQQPGELAKVAELVANKGVNIDAAISCGTDEIDFVFDDPATSRDVLTGAGYNLA